MEEIKYTIKRRCGQKSLRMYFSDKGELIVSASDKVSPKIIEDFVKSKAKWIEKNFLKYREHTFLTGDEIRILGKTYYLIVNKGKIKAVYMQDNKLLISTKHEPETKEAKKILFQYCKQVVEKVVRTRTEFWAEKMDREKPMLQICNSKTRWAVCYPARNLIRFSVSMVTLEPKLIDMIVVHELCHFFYANHGTMFKKLLAKWMPDIDTREKLLKQTDAQGWHKNLF